MSRRGRQHASFAAMESSQKRVAWTSEEDQRLVQLVEKHGTHNWPDVAAEMGPNRTSKSCSLRWRCFLNPNVKRPCDDPLSEWEIAVIVEAQKAYGNRWTLIASLLPGRCNNDIKNYFNLYLKAQVPAGSVKNKYLEANLSLQDLLRDAPQDILEKEREAAEASAGRMPHATMRAGSGTLAQQDSVGHPGSTVRHMLYQPSMPADVAPVQDMGAAAGAYVEAFAHLPGMGLAPPTPSHLPRTGLQGLPTIKTGTANGMLQLPGVVTTPGPPGGPATGAPASTWAGMAPPAGGLGVHLGKRSFSMSAGDADYAALLESASFLTSAGDVHHNRVQSAPMVLPPGHEMFGLLPGGVDDGAGAADGPGALMLKRHRSAPVPQPGFDQLLGMHAEQLLGGWDAAALQGQAGQQAAAAAFARLGSALPLDSYGRGLPHGAPGAAAAAAAAAAMHGGLHQGSGQQLPGGLAGLGSAGEEGLLRNLITSAMAEASLAGGSLMPALGLDLTMPSAVQQPQPQQQQQQRGLSAGLHAGLPPLGPHGGVPMERRVSEGSSGRAVWGPGGVVSSLAAAAGQQQQQQQQQLYGGGVAAGLARSSSMFEPGSVPWSAAQHMPGSGDDAVHAAFCALGGNVSRLLPQQAVTSGFDPSGLLGPPASAPNGVTTGAVDVGGAGCGVGASNSANSAHQGERTGSNSESNTASPLAGSHHQAAAAGGLAGPGAQQHRRSGSGASPLDGNGAGLAGAGGAGVFAALLKTQQRSQLHAAARLQAIGEGSPCLAGSVSSLRSSPTAAMGHQGHSAGATSLQSSPRSMAAAAQLRAHAGAHQAAFANLDVDHALTSLLGGATGGKRNALMTAADEANVHLFEGGLAAPSCTRPLGAA